jgi:ubiquitin C-terminal hydrolase
MLCTNVDVIVSCCTICRLVEYHQVIIHMVYQNILVCCSQHDAHEFLIYLLEGLHEEVNRIQEKKKRFIDCSNEVETIR